MENSPSEPPPWVNLETVERDDLGERVFKKHDWVRFKSGRIGPYKELYGVTEENAYEVAYTEKLENRRIIYLKRKGTRAWLPAYASDLTIVERHAK